MPEPQATNNSLVPSPLSMDSDNMELHQLPFQGAQAPSAPFSQPSTVVDFALTTAPSENGSLSPVHLSKPLQSAGGALEPTHVPKMQLVINTSDPKYQTQQTESRKTDNDSGCYGSVERLFHR